LVSFAASAGDCPAATHFLLLRQKKVSKEKATLFVVPALRYGHAAVLGKSGVTCKLGYRLKQARALIHFSLCSSPSLQGLWGTRIRGPNYFPTPSWLGLKKLTETD
jgi:hypothetical protein